MTTSLSQRSLQRQFVIAVLLAVTVSIGLFAYGVVQGYGIHASYLLWNLFLALLPLVFALRLGISLRHKRWSAWGPLGWTLLWLLFLPNSFYMITDFIHLRQMSPSIILYAVVLFTSFIYLGVFLGFCSLILVHYELRRRLTALPAAGWVSLILLICSFGIYIGRDLRWNSWDVLINPGGLLFDMSDRLLRPDAYPMMFVTTLSFFVLLGGLYTVLWKTARLLRIGSSISK